MKQDDLQGISFEALGMTQAQVWAYFTQGPSSLTPEQRAKMKELYPNELSDRAEENPGISIRSVTRNLYDWLDQCAMNAPIDGISGFFVCLYEGADYFEAEFFGCPNFREDDSDWVCEATYSGEDIFVFNCDAIDPDWEAGLALAKDLLVRYLRTKRSGAVALKRVGVLAVGFSDGDVHIIIPKNKKPEK